MQRRDRPADVGVFVDDVVGYRGHAHRGNVMNRLEFGGDRQPDHLSRADDIRAEQLAVGKQMVDVGSGMHDQVDAVGQTLPGGTIQTEIGLADITVEHLEVTVGQRPETSSSSASVARAASMR